MYNIDTYMKIGYKHKICQDYIISGYEPFPYVILSDGCSGSEHSDCGARILTHTAKDILQAYHHSLKTTIDTKPIQEKMYTLIGNDIIDLASDTAKALYLDSHSLDATLIIMFSVFGMVYIYIYGDGMLLLKYRDGTIGYAKVSYPVINRNKTAPYYLNYRVNKQRNQNYIDNFPNYKTYKAENITTGIYDTKELKYDEPVILKADPRIVSVCLISSDGLDSFTDLNSRDSLPLNDVVTNALDFKSLYGEFISKRMNRYIKLLPKGIVHTDDLSIGGMWLEDTDA